MNRDRLLLETAIEKELSHLVKKIQSHARDFTFMYMRKNNMEPDRQLFEIMMNVVDLGIQEGFQRQVPFFQENIKGVLDKALNVSEEESFLEESVEVVEVPKAETQKVRGRPSLTKKKPAQAKKVKVKKIPGGATESTATNENQSQNSQQESSPFSLKLGF